MSDLGVLDAFGSTALRPDFAGLVTFKGYYKGSFKGIYKGLGFRVQGFRGLGVQGFRVPGFRA